MGLKQSNLIDIDHMPDLLNLSLQTQTIDELSKHPRKDENSKRAKSETIGLLGGMSWESTDFVLSTAE